METPIRITRTERADIPLLLAQMDKMNIVALLSKHFLMHGNWQELSFGETLVVWLAYILMWLPNQERCPIKIDSRQQDKSYPATLRLIAIFPDQ